MSQIDELRQIIIGDDSELLSALKKRVEDIELRAKDVAEVLPPAIDAQLQDGGQRLAASLQKPVSIGLKQAIRSEPKEYAEILYPVMAPSIRRAISQAISSLLITINRTIESATSVNGIRMRIQSIRTGVPYAELALRQSLLYRVDHLYLIDRETGLLIQDVAAANADSLDSDAVSAMFSAIQSFVQDSFSQDESARLTDLRVGDHNVWVAHGPKVMLACVILGDAPESLKNQLYDALDSIRTSYANPIAEFNGDNHQFDGVDQLMSPLLQMQVKDEMVNKSGGFAQAALPLIITGILLLGIGYYWFSKSNKVTTVEYFLGQTPGIVSTDVYWHKGQLLIEGFKDPDANIPYEILAAYGLSASDLNFKMIPFRSLEAAMELQRFQSEMSLPAGLEFARQGDEISLSGEASILWLIHNEARLRQLAADRRLNISQLRASAASVVALLYARLGVELDSIEVTAADSSDAQSQKALIQGQATTSQLGILNALFSGSHWVRVSVVQH